MTHTNQSKSKMLCIDERLRMRTSDWTIEVMNYYFFFFNIYFAYISLPFLFSFLHIKKMASRVFANALRTAARASRPAIRSMPSLAARRTPAAVKPMVK